MKAFLKKISIILIGFISLSTIISAGSFWALRHSSFYKPSFLVNTVKEKQFDYIILGASTGLTTLNTKVVDSIIDTRGINLSMDDTDLSSQYLMLQHFLAEGKSTKFCILAPSVKSFNAIKEGVSDNDYRFLMYINRSYVYNYYKSHEGKEATLMQFSKWMPMLGMSYYNTELFYPSLLSLITTNKRNRFDNKGNYTYPVTKGEDKSSIKFNEVQIDFNNSYLKKIKELCEASGIKLICYVSPMKGTAVVVNTKNYQVINHSILLNKSAYFYDKIHVNYLGRSEASKFFANELLKYSKL